jgi:hypothetical protein
MLVGKKKIGLYKQLFPVTPQFKKYINFQTWKETSVFLIPSQKEWKNITYPYSVNSSNAKKVKTGFFEFFSGIEYNLGAEYDWVTNPESSFTYDIGRHWTEINDFNLAAGDIKYVWEKSRFSFIYLLIREDIIDGTDNAEFILNEISSWINANPVNQGPNYVCSQEISLRIINWTYVLHFYRDSKFLTDILFDKIMHSVYWQLKHVRSNINFSRIAVRNNHAITETLMLYIGGIMYPFYPESAEWKQKGKKWFEQEVAYQVYPDGTFLQFSMNYHRVLIQLFNTAFIVADKFGEEFSNIVYERAYKSLNFLFQCQEPTNGRLPNYGANDGALFFPLTSCEYRDYRPSLNTLHYLLTGINLYEDGPWIEESKFYHLDKPVRKYQKIIQLEGWIQFNDGGYYLLREKETLTFIRCGSHRDRPSQADNLHIDLWANGTNVLLDAGSYKYNASSDLVKYFMGTSSHNTVMLDDFDQMLKGKRFIWYFWTKRIKVELHETENEYIFKGSISCFRYLNKNIIHEREVRKLKNSSDWFINDVIVNKPNGKCMKQLWHPAKNLKNKFNYQISSISNNVNIYKEIGWISSNYGVKTANEYFVFSTESEKISTRLKFEILT